MYRLKSTSLANVRQMSRTQAFRTSLADPLRAMYANQARIEPHSFDEIKDEKTGKVTRHPVYLLDDIYDEGVILAKMAEDIFEDFPKLIEANQEDGIWSVSILDQELFDCLQEGVVNKAFLDYRQLRNGTPKTQEPS